MAKATPSQRKTAGRVMHEFVHGELKSGPDGRGGKVKSRQQAIAIALSESGESRYDSAKKKRHNLVRSKRKEAKGETGQQEREGRGHVGASGKRESSKVMGGKNATRTTPRGEKAARARSRDGSPTKAALYARAKARGLANRSRMSKTQLENALG